MFYLAIFSFEYLIFGAQISQTQVVVFFFFQHMKSFVAWKQSVKNTLLMPWALLFAELVSAPEIRHNTFGSIKKRRGQRERERGRGKKAPCTEVRNWLWVIMHKYQMPWHFLSCQTIVFLSVYLQLMIEFHPPPPSHSNTPPKKKNKKK